MQSLLYNPYWHALGGSERVFVAMTDVLADRGDVRIMAQTLPDAALRERLGFPDIHVEAVEAPEEIALASAGLDLFACVTNTPPPPSHAIANIACIAFPFLPFSSDPRLQRLEERWLSRYRCFVYSRFSRTWTQERWGIDAKVIHPPVRLRHYEPRRKERIVLVVGRFFPGGHNKRHDLVAQTFARLPRDLRAKWRLVLAGGAMNDEESRRYVDEIRHIARARSVDVMVNVSDDELDDLYARARIFVHATGFGRSPDEPERAEHFGIVTAEAMSAGAVPLAFDDGGQPEIVAPGTGYLWRTEQELYSQLVALMRTPTLDSMAIRAVKASEQFSAERFAVEFRDFVDEVTGEVHGGVALRDRLAAALREQAVLEREARVFVEEARAADATVRGLQAEIEELRRTPDDPTTTEQGMVDP